MEYTVNSRAHPIDFGAVGVKEILQNISMILSTTAFSCPMHRDFAWVPEMIDAPINIVQAQIRGQLVEAIQTYEPRVEVASIEFETDALNGALKPVVRVMIDETEIYFT